MEDNNNNNEKDIRPEDIDWETLGKALKMMLDATEFPEEFAEGMRARNIQKTDVGNLHISTVNTLDQGMETAIRDLTGNTWPVERYKTFEDAVIGHSKWVEKAKDLEEVDVLWITRDPMRIKLKR